MQPRITPVRSGLTVEQVESLIRDDPGITIGRGMELLDRDLNVLDVVTPHLRECSVTRDNTATLHGTAKFTIASKLEWGRAVVRPFITITNGVQTARFNQGAYFTNTPAIKTDRIPATYTVDGYDILNGLNTLVGDSYAINVGESYLTKVEDILLAQGYTQFVIDPARSATTAPAAKGWPLDESTTWLQIVNELLSAVGYRAVYSDWDGKLICQAIVDIPTVAPEWYYTRGEFDGQMIPESDIVHDYFATPNRWVGIQGNANATTAPVEGNGVFTYVNENQGETSVSARDQVITRVMTITAADQSALVAAVMAEVSKDRNVATTMAAQTSANPLHWHMDVVSVETVELGIVKMQQVNWTMDLRTGNMAHNWAVA